MSYPAPFPDSPSDLAIFRHNCASGKPFSTATVNSTTRTGRSRGGVNAYGRNDWEAPLYSRVVDPGVQFSDLGTGTGSGRRVAARYERQPERGKRTARPADCVSVQSAGGSHRAHVAGGSGDSRRYRAGACLPVALDRPRRARLSTGRRPVACPGDPLRTDDASGVACPGWSDDFRATGTRVRHRTPGGRLCKLQDLASAGASGHSRDFQPARRQVFRRRSPVHHGIRQSPAAAHRAR